MLSEIKQIYQEQPGEHIFKPETPYERYPTIKLGLIFSMPLLRLLQKINIKFNPVYISFIGLIFNIIAGLFFSQGFLTYGAVCFLFAIVVDLIDGSFARLTNQYTTIKKWDPICDRFGKLACFMGLWYGQYHVMGIGIIGLFLIGFYYSLEVYATAFLPNRFSNPYNPSFSVWEVSFLIFFISPILNMVNVLLPVGVVLLLVLYVFKTVEVILNERMERKINNV